MPITNLPTFVEKQLLTAAQLNQIVTALQTKFSGNVSGSDLVWPLVTDGDIDFGGSNTLLNLPTLWNVVNAAEYDTFTDAVSALPSTGGAIYIPPGSTVTTDGINVTDRNLCIFGDGDASVLALTTAASSGYLLRHSGEGSYRFSMYNLTVSGGNTGSAQDGIQLRQPRSVKVQNVNFRNFSGRALWVTNSGTAGFYADNVHVHQCLFEGGVLNQLEGNDVTNLRISGCQFDTGTKSGIYVKPTSSSYIGRNIKITNNMFIGCEDSIFVHGVGTALNNSWGFINIVDNTIVSDTGTGITAGSATAHITKCQIRGNTIDSPGVDGISVCSQYGVVADNMIYVAAVNAIDLLASDNLTVTGNLARKAGEYGIDLGTCDECTVTGNDVSNCGTKGIDTADTAGANVVYNNVGAQLGPAFGGYAVDVGFSGASAAWSSAESFIPANTINYVGDSILITLYCEDGGGSNSTFIDVILDDGSDTIIESILQSVGTKGLSYVLIVRGSGGTSGYSSAANGLGQATRNATIDWTVDVSIKLDITSADSDAVIHHMTVAVMGGPERGPTS